MKKFLRNIALFCGVFFLIDKLFYIIIYTAPNLEVDKRLELMINGKINESIIIMGSSRGADNIIASQIEKETSLSAYNISYPGSNIEFHQFLLETLLRFNKKPKIIVLAVDNPWELLPENSLKFRVDRLYPLVKYNYINQTLINQGEKTILSKFLYLGRINRGNLSMTIKKKSVENPILACGSMPFISETKIKNFEFKNDTFQYNLNNELLSKRKAFIAFKNLCKKNKIQLIFCFSPNFKSFNKSFLTRIKLLSFPENKFFVYDTTNIKYKSSNYFYDLSHLNIKGAKIFTSELSEFIVHNKQITDNNLNSK
jgi:hypothetical protein